MTDSAVRRTMAGPIGLAVAFLIVHGAIVGIDLLDVDLNAIGDVTGVYRYWIDYWHAQGSLVGIDTNWVYPIGALPPMLIAGVLGDAAYAPVWMLEVVVLDAVAIVLLARTSRPAAWWWLLATACLGPVALGRIDAIALPFAIVGVLFTTRRPAVAAVLLTIATWIKVWPAALLLAMLIALRRRALVVAGAAITSAVVLLAALAAGGRGTLFSFIGAQTGRGLQIEAPVSALWLWDALLGVGGTTVYYDRTLLTYQLTGDGVAATAAVMTPVLVAGVVAVAVLGLLAARRRADPATLVALVALGLVTASVALNKVGSPQYFTWFVAPVVLGVIVAPRRFAVPIVLVPLLDLLTQVLYPWNYGSVIGLDPAFLVLLDLRDLGEFVLLGWTLVALVNLPAAVDAVPAHRRPAHGTHAATRT